MIIPNVPFYSNTPDDTHCYQAALKMILKFFIPEKEYSFEDLEKFSAKKEGLWTWPNQAHINLHNMGFEIINFASFDLERFAEVGSEYLIEKFGEEVGIIQIKMSDIPQEQRIAKEYLKLGIYRNALPTINDVKQAIDQGFLVGCNVNARTLNEKQGYAGHYVVIFGYDDENLFLHDPGLPAFENRKVTISQFLKAWEYPDAYAKNIAAFRKK